MPPTASISALLLLVTLHIVPSAQALSFNYTSFSPNTRNITYQGNAASVAGALELTTNLRHRGVKNSIGRAVYSLPVHLWDNTTGNLANFNTSFSFTVQKVPGQKSGDLYNMGDGLAFFLVPYGSDIPANSSGGFLALFNASNFYSSSLPGHVPTVAVEFDTFPNDWDPYSVHVGIDVGNITSAVTRDWTTTSEWAGATVDATIAYDAVATRLSVFFSDRNGRDVLLTHVIDLRTVLPEWVSVGVSATTGGSGTELHRVRSWSFQSSLEDTDHSGGGEGGIRIWLLAGMLAGVLGCPAAGIASFIVWQRLAEKRRIRTEDDGVDEGEFGGGEGPKKFAHRELAQATSNFAKEGMLGRGGFGEVYRGVLSDPAMEVAIKKYSRDSKQGGKEFVWEVKIISRLRHRNLVKLVGWCHEKGDLLLVYEYMPNGSLDTHLFGGEEVKPLSWPRRYNIAQGVAAALLYLHEECEQYVVHRDVKSSNVMLDGEFNAKLGDFGLARLVDHGVGLQTTVVAGTPGYLAPECATIGKFSKASDVYSFGVLALEIACGRRPYLASRGRQACLVEWVWDLYNKKQAAIEAADERLGSDFDQGQMERLMVVGLWCAHPDFWQRPSMRQVVAALNMETPLPDLPAPRMPIPASYGLPTGRDWPDLSKLWLTSQTGSAVAGFPIAAAGTRAVSC